jgi:hypothetical protein
MGMPDNRPSLSSGCESGGNQYRISEMAEGGLKTLADYIKCGHFPLSLCYLVLPALSSLFVSKLTFCISDITFHSPQLA